jgi:two-component system sensor kinase FixL
LPARDVSLEETATLAPETHARINHGIFKKKVCEMSAGASNDFRAVLAATSGHCLVLTPDLRIVAASDGFLRVTMTEREAIVGREIFEVFPDNPAEDNPSGVANLRASLERILKSKRPDTMSIQRYDMRRPDGEFEERYWSPYNSPVLDQRGAVEWIVHRVDDVSDHVCQGREKAALDLFTREQTLVIDELRRSYENQHKTRDALKENEARLRSILAAIPDAVVTVDEQGEIESFSPAASRLFGYAPEEVVGKNVNILMPSPSGVERDGAFAQNRAAGQEQDSGAGPVLTGRRRDGTQFPLELTVGEVWIGNRRLITAFIRDITERQVAEERLQKLQSELLHVSRVSAMDQMASALAHELNQPLTAIVNYLNAAKRSLPKVDGPLLPRARELIGLASAQAMRASQIIGGLRNFIEKKEPNRAPENPNSIVEQALALGFLGAAEAKISVRLALAPDLPPVLADKIQLQQVLINLIRNAVEAMQNATRRELVVATSAEEGTVEITVSDTGPGLSPDILNRLFQPFVTTKEKGMGIGLTICRSIVEAHGGRIWATPNRDGGATFRFRLPSMAAEAADLAKWEEELHAEDAASVSAPTAEAVRL